MNCPPHSMLSFRVGCDRIAILLHHNNDVCKAKVHAKHFLMGRFDAVCRAFQLQTSGDCVVVCCTLCLSATMQIWLYMALQEFS